MTWRKEGERREKNVNVGDEKSMLGTLVEKSVIRRDEPDKTMLSHHSHYLSFVQMQLSSNKLHLSQSHFLKIKNLMFNIII